MTQYVGTDMAIVDAERDPLGISVAVYPAPDGTDCGVPVQDVPELVEVLLDPPYDLPRAVWHASMFDDPGGLLAPPAHGLLGLTQAYLRRLDNRRDYEMWDGEECETVAGLLDDIAQYAALIRSRLT